MHTIATDRYVMSFGEIDGTALASVGGKGARLGELSRIDGIRVPAGFCVTTNAFRRAVAESPLDDLLERLSTLHADDRTSIRARSAECRRTVEAIGVPTDVAAAVTDAVTRLGDDAAYAVRSSATAEDLATTSFAGLHDTFLDVAGAAILLHLSRCWASLFTERAVTYRARNRVDHRSVRMAVVVQRMALAEAAGVAFTADPLTSNRKIVCVEASLGLGEALLAGEMSPEVYKVRDDRIVERGVDDEARDRPALTDVQVVRLAQQSRRIEGHFGSPQDIEWCLVDDDFQIVQTRPITTLFPVPAMDDTENHVYLSVGHQQMMTDAMKPLGLSAFQLTAARPMYEAGGRLFVDATRDLASPSVRAALFDVLGRSDPLIRDALQTVVDRGDLLPSVADGGPGRPPPARRPDPIEADPAIVAELIGRIDASLATLRRDIRATSGPARFDFIRADIEELKRIAFDPLSSQVVMAGMEARWWLNESLERWLGDQNAADTLTQSVAHNVTSEMGLALLDVADVIRPHAEVVTFLRHVREEDFLEELPNLPGGHEARDAIQAYLDRYGMRCVGEIDITRPRWSEQPTTLVPVILAHVENFEPGAAERRFAQGRKAAAEYARELLGRLRTLPDGDAKAEETERMIERLRTFAGYREYPKYGIVSRYFVYKQALLEEAAHLVQAGVIADIDDISYLTFQELHDVVRTHQWHDELIRERKQAFRWQQRLTPPRVLTSEGEVVSGAYRRGGLPRGALVGLAVSSGVVEGRARVVREMADADLEPGDVLVTVHTDPSWSPLFVGISGVVTEVGGLMTHGAVIAREYGLPAVVGVERATQVIRDGQRIRVDGTHGYVEVDV
jgi:pyruvate,water dikinase